MADRRILCSLVTAAALALSVGAWAQASPSTSQSQRGQTASQPSSNTWGQPGETGWNKPGTNHINQQPSAYNTARNGEPFQASSQSTESSQAGSAGQVPAADKAFMKKAAQGGLAEVQLGQLATQNASDPAVKQFGQRVVDDHTKANDQLKSLAQQKGVTLPTDLNAKDQATKARLEKLHGAAFDRAYMNDMVKDHTKDVAEFRHESQAAKDSDVKQFAAQTLPTLQDHLKQAKSTDQQVAKANASSQAKKKTGSPE